MRLCRLCRYEASLPAVHTLTRMCARQAKTKRKAKANRARQARMGVKKLRAEFLVKQERNGAAETLQRVYRGRLGRRRYLAIQTERERAEELRVEEERHARGAAQRLAAAVRVPSHRR